MIPYTARVVLLCWIAIICSCHGDKGDFEVNVDSKGRYQVLVGGNPWLYSGPTFFTANNRVFSTGDGSLKLTKKALESGWDDLGAWNITAFYYKGQGSSFKVKVMVKWYKELPLVLFGQQYLTLVSGASSSRESVSSGFPSFPVGGGTKGRELGYLAYGGIMTGDTYKHVDIWSNKTIHLAQSGLNSGPLVLFDKSTNALIITAFTNFMAASVEYGIRRGVTTASWGVLGAVDQIPDGYTYWTALMYSGEGVNRLMSQWGDVMRWYYKKSRAYTESDLTNNYIGYWTDNGAYYYYKTEGKLNYEDTILDAKKYADKENIPYRYVQYDSWWYPKGPKEGVTEWTSMMDIFPSGLRNMWQKTGWPVLAHNRWWSNATVYAKENGGKYDFYLENKTSKAIPLDQRFWDDLMVESKQWGLITYEQDWLNYEFNLMDVTVESLTLGRQWLHQMAKGALRSGIMIQYCMAPSRHILTSLELPAVTQARVSNDYQPGEDNWKIGLSSMFAHAMGIAPFKDNFWTTEHQPCNPYNKSEPHAALHALVATLSTGGVGPGDRLGHSNASLIMRSCNGDGLILKPSKPAMALDKQLIMTAYTAFRGEMWSTYSYISGLTFGVILGADFSQTDQVAIGPSEARLYQKDLAMRSFPYLNPSKVSDFSKKSPIILSQCSKVNFCLYYTTPVLKLGSKSILIQGEMSKWVPVSPKRVTSITIASDDIQLSLNGSVKENVTFTFMIDGVSKMISCQMTETGTAVLSIAQGKCIHA